MSEQRVTNERTLFWRTVTSTTFWFNIITFAIAALALPEVADIIPEKYAKLMLVVNPLGNLIIRQFLTATPITRMAADRARARAGMPAHKKVGNRWTDPPALPGEANEAPVEEVEEIEEPVTTSRRRRKTDQEENPKAVGRRITPIAVKKKRYPMPIDGPVGPAPHDAQLDKHKNDTGFKIEGLKNESRKRKNR